MNVITNKFRSIVGLRDPYNVEKPMDYVIHYLKDDVGAPLVNGVMDECCLNSVNSTLYKFDGSNWNVVTLVSIGMCFLFSESGSINAGNGHNIPNMMIYEKEIDGIFSKRYVTSGVMVIVKNKSLDNEMNCLRVFKNSPDEWVAPNAVGFTVEEIQNIVALMLLEGEAIDLSYAANQLTVSCELADVGDNTVNKGVSSFSDDSFGANSGYITIEKVDGGAW